MIIVYNYNNKIFLVKNYPCQSCASEFFKAFGKYIELHILMLKYNSHVVHKSISSTIVFRKDIKNTNNTNFE